jgi:transcriptional regulator with PAS, ATPase and Fis domain
MSVLLDYNYPGNIRELENILQHAFVLCQAPVIQKKHLPAYLFVKAKQEVETPGIKSIDDFEKSRIEEALSRNRYSRAATAKELGMHVATLWRKIKKLGITTGRMP